MLSLSGVVCVYLVQLDSNIEEDPIEIDIYSSEALSELLDDDELSPEEEGFMKGYDQERNEITNEVNK